MSKKQLLQGSKAKVTLDKSITFSTSISSGAIALLDALIIFCTGSTIFYLHLHDTDAHFTLYFGAMLLNVAITFVSFYNNGLYNFRSLSRPEDTVIKLVIISIAVFSSLLTLAFVFEITNNFSRAWTLSWFLSSVSFMVLLRISYYYVIQRWGQEGKVSRNIAVIGGEQHGNRLLEVIHEQKEPWMRVVGVFEDRYSRVPDTIADSPVLGNIDDLIQYVQENRIDDVIIALPWSAEARMLEIIDKLEVLPVDIRVSPDMLGYKLLNHSFTNYCGLPVLNVSDKPIKGWHYIMKTLLDKVLSALILLFISPIMLLIAIAIKLDSPGPVFFKQKRYGFNNQLIEVLKFRSMRSDMQDENAEKLTTKNDPRVTKIGAFLRRSSLDELPQFINVIKGDMSIVGPRPHATQAKAAGKLYQQQVDKYAARHKVTPGITGWAQVNGWRGETDTEEKIQKRVEHDIFYINNWSVFLDIRIILRTVLVFINHKNAY